MGQLGCIVFQKRVHDKVKLRAQCISMLPNSAHDGRRLMQQLVFLVLTWAAGVVSMDCNSLKPLRGDIIRALHGRTLQDLPLCVAFEISGWRFDPVANAFHSAVDAAVRYHVREPCWQDQVGLHIASGGKLLQMEVASQELTMASKGSSALVWTTRG